MSNFDIHSFFKNQYINEAINSKLNSNEMSKEEDAKILISALEKAIGGVDDRFGSGGYNGRDGYYLRVYDLEYWEDEEVDAVKKAFEMANTQTEKYDFEFYSVTDYDEDPGERTYPASISFFAVEKPVNEIDMNDPVVMKARAAKMADEKEMARQASLDKKYGSTFMDKLDAEISLKQELQDLKDEREQLMIDMEQEAEPEGGEIADRYGSRLNDIDARMAEIKPELDDLRMYESVNESSSSEEKRIAMRAIKALAKYRGVSEDEARNDLMRAAKELGSLKEAILDIKETIELGKNLNEELCAKGKAYRKRRMAAGEKSSAYLSGRAVKVCKGQMSGRKKKK